jgi:hypothetical protein
MTKQLSISEMIELARAYKMTAEQEDAQRRSFVFGNVAIENPSITREFVDSVAEQMAAASAVRV